MTHLQGIVPEGRGGGGHPRKGAATLMALLLFTSCQGDELTGKAYCEIDASAAVSNSMELPAGVPGPSCAGLPATCGPKRNESCCKGLAVPGGTYNRSNDPNFPATVSSFVLDKYQVTVARFRAFLDAGKGTQQSPPTAGDGVHPVIAGSGWDAMWNASLLLDASTLRDALKCNPDGQTWTDAPVGNENRPINCIAWYEAFAFCAWDGGRLPTEAEWNYAAAGGDQQRVYPPVTTAAEYRQGQFCDRDSWLTEDVGAMPECTGRWGQADLAGNVREWNLDWYSATYDLPCDDCAHLETASSRVVRGFPAGFQTPEVVTAIRSRRDPRDRDMTVGFRCARIMP
jgi:formylglycine-generating enzyme required for sulfatase activity